jgi:hypothetical protein
VRAHFNNFILDGIDNNSYATSHQGYSSQVVVPAPDAIQEFKLQTDNYSAEFGRTGGGAVNVATRSGGNDFHGAVWEFLRNTSLNAVGFFKPTGNSKPVLIQNQFGGALGGPIRKNKMFFFADYEGFRQVTRQLTFATLPTIDQRNGIFTIPVKNPYTGQTYPDNVIPAAQIIPFAQKVFRVCLPRIFLASPITSNGFPARPTGVTKGTFATITTSRALLRFSLAIASARQISLLPAQFRVLRAATA